MNRQLVFTIGLNLSLAVLVIWAAGTRHDRVATAPAIAAQLTNRAIHLGHLPDAKAPVVENISLPFHWAEIESSDYRVYIANLRSIGCPELTIRDIIEAELNAVYSERVKIMVDGVTGRFWDFMVHTDEFEKLVEDKSEELDALALERDAVMSLLLDDDKVHTSAMVEQKQAEEFEELRRRLDFLTEDTIALVYQAQQRHKAASDAARTDESALSEAQRRRLYQERARLRDSEIQSVLTAEEWVEYQLRNRSKPTIPPGLDVTDDEVRQIAAVQANRGDKEQIRHLLGAERFAAYERGLDGDYQHVLRITDRFDLPDDTAVQVFQMRKKTEMLAREVREDRSRSVDERIAVLQAMEAETANSIANVLGPKPFKAYQKYSGDWLDQLSNDVK